VRTEHNRPARNARYWPPISCGTHGLHVIDDISATTARACTACTLLATYRARRARYSRHIEHDVRDMHAASHDANSTKMAEKILAEWGNFGKSVAKTGSNDRKRRQLLA
jgi:hypothetical protein